MIIFLIILHVWIGLAAFNFHYCIRDTIRCKTTKYEDGKLVLDKDIAKMGAISILMAPIITGIIIGIELYERREYFKSFFEYPLKALVVWIYFNDKKAKPKKAKKSKV